MQTIVITDLPREYEALLADYVNIISAMNYLLDPRFATLTPVRIINLCSSYRYQSIGYYVSLLAEARGHKIIPSVMTIQDMKSSSLSTIIDTNINEDIQKILKPIRSDEFVLSIYFGKNIAKRYAMLCRKLHGFFPLPIFRVYFKFKEAWTIQKIEPLSIKDVSISHHKFLVEAAKDYLARKRFHISRKKSYFYDLAILHDPTELTPPSNSEAIKKFILAGEKIGIHVELIEKEDFKTINEYDALFIRETTSVNHHTYHFARRADAEQLVVIDDPQSILKCTNKVYLAELLTKHHIATPPSTILSNHNYKIKKNALKFPCVLKQPDSSFSQGIKKVETIEELDDAIQAFFKTSELIIAQEFMPSDFDWRIGVINNQPLYACRYYMAKGHWQIYNWLADEPEGDFETVAIEKVPLAVMQTALKAAKLVGEGLYGVDLKQIGEEVYVIEVNENPNIDHGIEDQIVGDQLYMTIMQTFLNRIKKKHGYE